MSTDLSLENNSFSIVSDQKIFLNDKKIFIL